MSVQDLRLEVRKAERLSILLDVVGVSPQLESEIVGTIRLDVGEGYLEIEIEKEKDWTGPIETTIA